MCYAINNNISSKTILYKIPEIVKKSSIFIIKIVLTFFIV